jgi:hypothetical protein
MVITAELAIMGYFYAMRSCEFTRTARPGRTRVITFNGLQFRDKFNNTIPHDSPSLHRAFRVTVTFADQKNGQKHDKRTHQRTRDPVLCPVARLVSLVRRIRRTIPTFDGLTPICAYRSPKGDTLNITATYLRKTLRTVCNIGGGEPTFGFTASEIGTRSIRSGAAMSLFLANHSVAKIMILGQWSSDAFLIYLRPQVLEWTNNMSGDMLSNESFFDATDAHKALSSDPRIRQSRHFNAGDDVTQHQSKGKINPHS